MLSFWWHSWKPSWTPWWGGGAWKEDMSGETRTYGNPIWACTLHNHQLQMLGSADVIWMTSYYSFDVCCQWWHHKRVLTYVINDYIMWQFWFVLSMMTSSDSFDCVINNDIIWQLWLVLLMMISSDSFDLCCPWWHHYTFSVWKKNYVKNVDKKCFIQTVDVDVCRSCMRVQTLMLKHWDIIIIYYFA